MRLERHFVQYCENHKQMKVIGLHVNFAFVPNSLKSVHFSCGYNSLYINIVKLKWIVEDQGMPFHKRLYIKNRCFASFAKSVRTLLIKFVLYMHNIKRIFHQLIHVGSLRNSNMGKFQLKMHSLPVGL
jgi:hypothetical protein